MKKNILKIIIMTTLFIGFCLGEVNADESRSHRSSQIIMMERHQDERRELRETHKAELDKIRELHRMELNALLNKQEEERGAERSKSLRR